MTSHQEVRHVKYGQTVTGSSLVSQQQSSRPVARMLYPGFSSAFGGRLKVTSVFCVFAVVV